MSPRKGLNVPLVTALDEAGEIIESDQRRIIRHTIQNGHGVDSIFLVGTTGEFNHLTNQQRQQIFEIGIDETRKINNELASDINPIEVWVGVTAQTKTETIANIQCAKDLGADMIVIAPLTIADLPPKEIVGFFENEIIGRVSSMPISLYDNPDISAAPEVLANMPVDLIEELRRFHNVVCLKASTSREVLQNYMNAFSGNGERKAFDIYFGNAPLMFEIDEMKREAGMTLREVAGVVSGVGNLFPREWKQAWQAVINHDSELSAKYKSVFADFEKLTFSRNGQYVTSKMISGIKQGLYFQKIISSPLVAKGTPALTNDEVTLFNEGFIKILDKLLTSVDANSLSVYG